MSYVLNPPGGDNVQGDVDPNQVAYGDPDDAGKIKGSDNFTFVDETGGNGPTVEITGDKPVIKLQDDTDATDYRTELLQSGASMYINHKDSAGTNNEMVRFSNNYVHFNQNQEDIDVQVASENTLNMFMVDAGQDNVGIGGAPGSDVERLHVKGAGTSDSVPLARFETVNGVANSAPHIEVYRNSPTPQNGDDLGEILFIGNHAATSGGPSAGAQRYARIRTDIRDAVTGSEEGMMRFDVSLNGGFEEFIRLDASGGSGYIVFNEDSGNIDTRIESNNNQNMLKVDAGQDNVGIGTSPASDVAALHVKADSPGFESLVRLHVDDDGAAVGPILEMFRESASPAAGDDLGQIIFTGRDSANAKQKYFQIKGEIRDPQSGTDDGELIFIGPSNSTDIEFLRLSKTVGVVVNEGSSGIVDFRVEGGTDVNLLVTDAANDNVGIGAVPASGAGKFQIDVGNSTQRALDLISRDSDANSAPTLRLNRISGSPAVQDAIGRISIVGEDSDSNSTEYASIEGFIQDPTSGGEDGDIRFKILKGGTTKEYLRMNSFGVIFNELGADQDFKIESNDVANMFNVNGGQNNVGIGTVPTSGLAGAKPVLHVKAEDDNIGILIEDDAADSDMGPEMVLYRSSGSPAVNDLLGRIRFEGQDSGGNPHTYFRMSSQIKDPTDASEDGNFFFSSRESGALFDVMKINGASLEINPNTNSNINFNVRTNLTTQAQSFFRTYNNTDIAERYTEVLRGSRTLTSTPVSITADRCYGSNIVTDTGASVVNLPEAVPGMHLQVVNKNISGISIAPNGTDTINGSTSSFSVQHGWVIAKVICIADGEWVVAEAN